MKFVVSLVSDEFSDYYLERDSGERVHLSSWNYDSSGYGGQDDIENLLTAIADELNIPIIEEESYEEYPDEEGVE